MEDNDTTSGQGDGPSRPLGSWLRIVDHLLAARSGEILADERLGRREWMLLRALSGERDTPGLADHLTGRTKKLHALVERGWVASADDSWTLTDDGRAAATRIAERLSAAQAEITDAVSADDLRTTIASLEAMAHAAGGDEDAAARGFGPRRGRGFGRPGFGRGRGFGRPDVGRGAHEHRSHVRDPHDGPRAGSEHGHDRGHGFGHGVGHGFGHGVGHGFGHGPHPREQAFERGFEAGFRAAHHG